MIDTIIFDLDNTLYEYEPCHQAGLIAAFLELGKFTELNQEELDIAYKQAQDEVKSHVQDQAASHNRLLYFKFLCESLDLSSVDLPLRLEDVYWNAYLNEMKLFEGVLDLLDWLKSRNLKLGLCTDLTAQIQLKKLQKLNLGNYFIKVVTSEEAGVEKPNPIILQLVLNRLHSKAEDSIFIGDHYEKDIVGSSNIGMKAIHFSKQNSPHKLKVSKISELKEIIEKLIDA